MPPNIPTPPTPPAQPPPATRGDEDPMSPTVMLQAFLRSRGIPLNSSTMQQALTSLSRGDIKIPGLVTDTPSDDTGVGQGGNVARAVESAPAPGNRGLPIPPIPPAQQSSSPPAQTSTQPAPTTGGGGGMDLSNLGALIAAGAGAGGGMYLAGRGGAPQPGAVPQPGASVPPPPDPGDPALFPPGSAAAQVQTGDRFNVQPPPEPDPLQAALAKAVQPNMVPSATGPSTPLTSPDPRVTPPSSDINIPPPPVPVAPPTAAVPPRPNVTTEVLPRPPMPARVGAPRVPMPMRVPPRFVLPR